MRMGEFVEWWRQGKIPVLGEEPGPSASLSTTGLSWTDLGSSQSLALERLATDSLWNGTKIILTLKKINFLLHREHCVLSLNAVRIIKLSAVGEVQTFALQPGSGSTCTATRL